MMPRQKNKTIFTGTYQTAKRKLGPRVGCTPRKTVHKFPVELAGGPLDGQTVFVSDFTCTLPITINGQTGRYVLGEWQQKG